MSIRRERTPAGVTNRRTAGYTNPVVVTMKKRPPVAPTQHFTQKERAPVKTRSELLGRRRHSRLHFFDRYDLNGDGVVDPFEVRLGSLVDVNNDGVIDDDEKELLRDLIDQGKLKHMSILQDKSGGEAKKAFAWPGTKERRRLDRAKAQEREARAARIAARSAADEEFKFVGDLPQPPSESTAKLLDTLSKSMSPTKVLTQLMKPVYHRGAAPMDRVMTGRKTPTLEYKGTPLHRTRSELMAERRAKMIPHATFDLDGDGQVDPLEHYIASMLDINNDGSLDEAERAQAKALIARLKKFYVTGLERGGPSDGSTRIFQRADGVVMNGAQEFVDRADVAGAVGFSASSRREPGSSRERLFSPTASARSKATAPSTGTPRTPSIWSPPVSTRSSARLARAGSAVSLADELRSARSGGTTDRHVAVKAGGADVLRLTGRSRPSTGMSRLTGV